MKKNVSIIIKLCILSIMLLCTMQLSAKTVSAKTYKVTPANVGKNCTNYKSYNKYTKHAYGINWYMEKFEKAGGGKLILKKGTYNISHTIYVPSNVTIVLEDGVVLKKIKKTGTSRFSASTSIFMLCPPSKGHTENAFGKYKSSKNVKILGEGNATINLNYTNGGAGIILSHNKNVTISGITFKNMKVGHFIELNGTNKATISNNVFKNSYKKTLKKNYNKEAINIDIDDPTTNGLNVVWSKSDKTPCKNIKIENNVFDGVTRGVGTHKYSQKNGKNIYHTKIVIKNNTFKNIYDNGVFVLNWKGAKITDNTFDNIGNSNDKSYSSGAHGISGGGIDGITITGNTFNKIKRCAVYFGVQKNVGSGSQYSKVKVSVTTEQIKKMTNNFVTDCGYDINDKYIGFDILIFKGNSERKEENRVGIDLVSGEITGI